MSSLRALTFVALFLAAGSAAAQESTLRIVYGFPAGSSTEVMTRVVADHMRATLGHPVIVENRPGAEGIIAAEAVKAAAADGRTLLMVPSPNMTIAPHVRDVRYHPFKDFAPVAHVSSFQLGLGIAGQVPVTTISEYMALVKKDPRAGYYAVVQGGIPHLMVMMVARAAGVEMTPVPYKGTALAVQAAMAGEVPAVGAIASDIARAAKQGRVRLLAIGGAARAPAFPDVPTFREAGFDVHGEGWFALFSPAGTPRAVAQRLSWAAISAVRDPVVQEKIRQIGLEPTGLGPNELAAVLQADYDRWGSVVRASGFKLD